MPNAKFYLVAATCVSILATSCKKSDDINPYANLSASVSYTENFKGADGKSSIDFSGQTARLDMFMEIDSLMKLGTKQIVSATTLKNMYANTNNAFRQAALNTSGKKLKDKTGSALEVATDAQAAQTRIENYFDDFATASASFAVPAIEGVAGIYSKTDAATGKVSKYLVDAKGIEISQVIAKSLIGAVMFDQIVNGYLGDSKQAVDNSALVSGKNYTQLEHHWDEAYGYLTSNAKYPSYKADGTTKNERALGGYAYQDYSTAEATAKTAELYLAFLKGRAAVVNKDDKTRKEQIALIRASLEKTLAKVTISYLKKTQDAIRDNKTADAVHSLGEGLGFLYSLRFAYNAKITSATSNRLIEELLGTKGYYGLTAEKLTNVRTQIATAFGISAEATTTH